MVSYASVAEAIKRTGLRVVFSPGVPGPWSVAARMILDCKGIDYLPVAQIVGEDDMVLREWTFQQSAPVAVLDEERPRARWDEILLLAERLAPTPRLIPADQAARCEMMGLAHAICGEDGLGWNFRLYKMVAWEDALAGRSAEPVFLTQEQVDRFKVRYGDPASSADGAKRRMVAILHHLAAQLRTNRANGSAYLVGDELTAADIYWTAFSNLVAPMQHDHCPMPDGYRAMAEAMQADIGGDLDPILIEHRETMLVRHLQTPLQF